MYVMYVCRVSLIYLGHRIPGIFGNLLPPMAGPPPQAASGMPPGRISATTDVQSSDIFKFLVTFTRPEAVGPLGPRPERPRGPEAVGPLGRALRPSA